MQKATYVVGLAVGAAAALVTVVAIPSLVPSSDDTTPQQNEARVKAARVIKEADEDAREGEKIQERARRQEQAQADLEARRRRLEGARLRANETTAHATLRNVVAAQAQFQAVARADENQNGTGEFGSFGEMSAAVGVRGGKAIKPPLLVAAFGKVEQGRFERSGYYFRIFLPQRGGRGLAERETGGFQAGDVDPELSETAWCCYAWPVERGVTGRKTLFVNQAGDVLQTSDGGYSGERGPESYAAFDPSTHSYGITGKTALDAVGNDRAMWSPAE